MNTRPTTKRVRGQRGFILATVLIFLIVLSLTAFLAAKLTRTDIQVVNNLQNEKEAFAIAEAGIHEAFYRMNVAIGDTSAVISPPFNASLAPIVPGRSAPAGVISYGINSTNTQFTSQVILTTNAPTTGTNNVVPTLQPASLQIPYSFNTADTVTPVDLGSTARLTIGWDVCVNGTDPGCSAAGAIRKLPLTNPRFVAKIVSTGRSGTATRKITAQAVDCIPSQTPGNGSLVSLNQNCNGIDVNGGNTITAAGVVQVNAGASSSNPSTCMAAQTGGSTSNIHASQINTVGNANGRFTPPATTGSLPLPDPYSGTLLPPCYGGVTLGCQPCPSNGTWCIGGQVQPHAVNSDPAMMNPGVYDGPVNITLNGNVTMASGYYVIAGGGLDISSSSVVGSGSGGVMIFNTKSGAVAADRFAMRNGNTTATLEGITDPNDPFYNVVLFQPAAPTVPLVQPEVYIQGGASTTQDVLKGLVYAPDAVLHLKGATGGPSSTAGVNIAGSVIVSSVLFQGNTGLNIDTNAGGVPAAQCSSIAYQIIGWRDFLVPTP